MMARKCINLTLTVDDDMDGRQFYTSGSTIRGTVVLELSKDLTPVSNISVNFLGIANVKFSIPCDEYSRRFANSSDICSVAQTVWDSHDHHQQDTCGLAAGVYEFPFTLFIPNNIALPSSYEIKHNKYVQYLLFAGISQSTQDTFSYKTASKVIQIQEIVDINTTDLTSPLSATEQKVFRSFFHAVGSISLSVKIPRGGYCLGESIAISATAENLSKEKIISLSASLTQKVVATGNATYKPSLLSPMLTEPGSKNQIMVFNKNNYRKTSEAGNFSHWDNVLLPIPSQSLTPTSSSCEFIKVSYVLNVALILHKKKDITVDIPITIGTIPFSGHSAVPHVQAVTNSDVPIIISQETYYNVSTAHPKASHLNHSFGYVSLPDDFDTCYVGGISDC